MTGPLGGMEGLGAIGSAYITFRGRTDQVDDDLRKGLDHTAKDADKITEKSGEKLGKGLASNMEEGVKDELKKPGFARRISDTLAQVFRRRKLKTTVDVDVDVDQGGSMARRLISSISRVGSRAGGKFASSFADAAEGPLSGIFKLVASIGSSVGNVGSQGPLGFGFGALILLGIPALVAAVASLLAVFYPLVNVLLLLPSALAVVGAAIVPIVAAFWGMSKAIAAVMSEDPKQIEAAFKGMSKGARQFALDVGQKVVPVIKHLQGYMQDAFFQAFGKDKQGMTVFEQLGRALQTAEGRGAAIPIAMANAARAAGQFTASLIKLVGNVAVQKFLVTLFNTTGGIFETLTPALTNFIIGLSNLGTVSLPVILSGVQKIGDILSRFGGWLTEISFNGGFDHFMDRLDVAWQNLKDLAGSGWNLIKAIVGSTEDQNAAQGFLDTLIETMDALTKFFESNTGKFAMRGLIDLAKILIVLLGTIIGSWTMIGAGIEIAKGNLYGLYKVVRGVYDWFDRLVGKVSWLYNLLVATSPLYAIYQAAGFASGGIITSPTMAMLGEGSKPEVVIPLTDPNRAQELARVSGLTSMLNQGQNANNGGNGTTIIFGTDSIKIEFTGAKPTEEEAYQTGTAVATGISDQLAKRNVRLGVRSLRG